jgi:Flp pilus assembly pilin Flp
MLDNINVRILAALSAGWQSALRRDEGQTLVEYALILVVISLGVLAAMTVLRDKIRTVFNDIATTL